MTHDYRHCTGCLCTLNNCADFKRSAAWAVACCPNCNHPAAQEQTQGDK